MLPIRALSALFLGAAMMFQSWGFIMPHQNPADVLILVNKTNRAPAVPPTLVLPNVQPTSEAKAKNIYMQPVAAAALEELFEAMELKYEKDPEANYSSLGGLIFDVLTQIPDDGDTPELETDTLKIRVEEILNHRVEWALVSKLPPKVEEDDEDEDDEKRDRKRRKEEDDD